MKETLSISAQGAQYIQAFIQALDHEGLNPKTLKEYASDLRQFIRWWEQQEEAAAFEIEAVTTQKLSLYRDAAQNNMALKPATINRRLIALKRFFDWAESSSLIPSDPSKPVKLVPEVKSSPRQMTDTEESALIAAAEHGGSLRDLTILIVMFHTGLRTMEVCDLIPDDISFDNRCGQLTVRSGKRNKQREVPLNALCRTSLETYMAILPPGSHYLFPSEKTGERLTERALRHLIQKYMSAASIEGLSAHDLRHRFGYVTAKQMPQDRLAQIMGHDNPDSTTIYLNGESAS
ncbi:tyrosine-type recombinase/integrase [Paenibacillus sp. R14(2021)]|uniref:tyrosine-type recombinase/integrase n=1 Tax=Paenibacillus sp. R14(2021) TaxID=2859228 RepID=UPI001C612186|nr:tyrosine-type recombinase/integrase [Paenibacillus sp. R14(2021)]